MYKASEPPRKRLFWGSLSSLQVTAHRFSGENARVSHGVGIPIVPQLGKPRAVDPAAVKFKVIREYRSYRTCVDEPRR